VLNPDAHIFVQEDFYQAEPDVVTAIMTQLSLKVGLEEWGDQAFTAARSEMKQLHLRKTSKPKHCRELSQVQRQTVLESHMSLMQKRDGKIKGGASLVEASNATLYTRRMLAHPSSPHRQYVCHASLTPRKGVMLQW
jgi:hypothetical protein